MEKTMYKKSTKFQIFIKKACMSVLVNLRLINHIINLPFMCLVAPRSFKPLKDINTKSLV